MKTIEEQKLLVITLVNNDVDSFKITRQSILDNPALEATHLIFDSSLKPVSEEFLTNLKNLHFIYLPPKGIYNSMNAAIEWAVSNVEGNPFILFLNSGDVLSPNFDLLTINPYQESVNIIYGKYRVVDPITGLSVEIDPNNWKPWHQYFTFKPISHQAILVRLSTFIDNGFFNSAIEVAADWDFILRCANREEFAYYSGIISEFYLGGFSTRNKKQANKELLDLRDTYGPNNWLFYILSYSFYIWRRLRLVILEQILEQHPLGLKTIRKLKGWN